MSYGCLEFSISKKYFEGQRVNPKGTPSFSTECKELGNCHSVFKQENAEQPDNQQLLLDQIVQTRREGSKMLVLKLKYIYILT